MPERNPFEPPPQLLGNLWPPRGPTVGLLAGATGWPQLPPDSYAPLQDVVPFASEAVPPQQWGRTSGGGSAAPPLGYLPGSPTFDQHMSPLAAQPVSYRAWPRPVPVPGWPSPGGLDWWEHTKRGHKGLLDFLLRRDGDGGGRGGGGGRNGGGNRRNDPDCQEEWADAAKYCGEAVDRTDPPRTPSGVPLTLEQCIKGRVSPDCGGSPIEYEPWRGGKKKKRY